MVLDVVDWKQTSRADFERLVNLLIFRERESRTHSVNAPDGRGGDGGIDIEVRSRRDDALIEIFQLKHYPEGFSSVYSSRRAHIKQSFETAMRHRPKKWILVIPGRPTPKEKMYVDGLKQGRPVKVSIIGETQLDNMLAKHEDIQWLAMRHPLKEALDRVGRGPAAMQTIDDIHLEAKRLGDTIPALSAYWAPQIVLGPRGPATQMVPLREDSHEKEPLGFRIDTQFDAAHTRERDAFGRILDWGANESVTLPTAVVKDVERVGPAWFAGHLHDVSVEIFRPVAEDVQNVRKVRLTSMLDRERLATLRGSVSYHQVGRLGATLTIEAPGGLRLSFRFPRDPNQSVHTNIQFEPQGHSAVPALRVIELIDSFRTADRLELQFTEGTLPLTLSAEMGFDVGDTLRQCIEDLAVLEIAHKIDFVIPEFVPNGLERIWIRVARQLTEGRRVIVPHLGSYTATLNTQADVDISPELRSIIESGGGLIVEGDEPWPIEVLGEEIIFRDLVMMCRVIVEDSSGILRRLEKGDRRLSAIVLKPYKRHPWMAFPRDSADERPQKWQLPGINEHPGMKGWLDGSGEGE
ncbi:hypothetical protein [Clavibacter nebraskensis]|uniref:hypothetical protein n=1 Tax=Clavibacter nebraskensis TaxID=31963 RepID=UPI003F4B2004